METILNRLEEIAAENKKLKTELQEAKDYADKLVEHRDMVCLPADLANLREANARFAMENHELQEKVAAHEDALRDIALFLSCGGYNDCGLVEFDPALYAKKIKEEITEQAAKVSAVKKNLVDANKGAKRNMNALNICCQKLEELERERDGWREAAYALGEAIPASWEELQPAAEQLRKFKEMVALQNEKTKNFLDIVDKHSKNVPMKKCPNCETYAKNSETKSDIIGDLWSVLDKTLYELPVGYIPAHTYESIPNMVEELVKENANMNNDWDKAMDTIEECMPQFFADAIDGSITEAVTILIKMLNDATLGEWSCLDELNEHGRYNNV